MPIRILGQLFTAGLRPHPTKYWAMTVWCRSPGKNGLARRFFKVFTHRDFPVFQPQALWKKATSQQILQKLRTPPWATAASAFPATAATGDWWQTTVTKGAYSGTWAHPAPAAQPAPPEKNTSSRASIRPAPVISITPSGDPAAPVWPAAAAAASARSLLPGIEQRSPLCLVPCPEKTNGPTFGKTSSSWFQDCIRGRLKRRRVKGVVAPHRHFCDSFGISKTNSSGLVEKSVLSE